MFSWNDTISKMNKNNSLKGLLKKLKEKNALVLLYTPMVTMGLNQLTSDGDINKFINNNEIAMLHIETAKGKRDVYLNKYDTYRFNNLKNSLSIIMYDSEIEIYF